MQSLLSFQSIKMDCTHARKGAPSFLKLWHVKYTSTSSSISPSSTLTCNDLIACVSVSQSQSQQLTGSPSMAQKLELSTAVLSLRNVGVTPDNNSPVRFGGLNPRAGRGLVHCLRLLCAAAGMRWKPTLHVHLVAIVS